MEAAFKIVLLIIASAQSLSNDGTDDVRIYDYVDNEDAIINHVQSLT
jgi:hypothetical protein